MRKKVHCNTNGDPYWVTKDGTEIPVKDMTSDHLRNCIANIFIRHTWREQYLPVLVEELKKRDD